MQKIAPLPTDRYPYLFINGLLVWISLVLIGCVTPRQLSYYQDNRLTETTLNAANIDALSTHVKITKGLILTIRVNSLISLDHSDGW